MPDARRRQAIRKSYCVTSEPEALPLLERAEEMLSWLVARGVLGGAAEAGSGSLPEPDETVET